MEATSSTAAIASTNEPFAATISVSFSKASTCAPVAATNARTAPKFVPRSMRTMYTFVAPSRLRSAPYLNCARKGSTLLTKFIPLTRWAIPAFMRTLNAKSGM